MIEDDLPKNEDEAGQKTAGRKLSTLSVEEETEIRKLAATRKAAHRLGQRAKVIVAMLDNPKLHATQSGVSWP